ncbi:MAG: gliding motility-associated C-terminal domain-containing protein, partial [Flavobacteriales bacterium]|nr:gliding motility-associated C-terminal domain-containing protein [Flavobacteriales bacterium]
DANNPVADAGPDQDLCSPDDQAVLAGVAPVFPATGTWTLVSGTGTLNDPADPNTTVTGLSVGENILRWTVDNGPCNNGTTSDDVSIFIYDAANADADAGPDQSLCTPVLSTAMAGSAVTFPAVGTWTLVSGQGSITTPNSPTTGVTGLGIGENVFAWTVDNGPCANGVTSDTVSIFVFNGNDPAAAAGPDQSICTPLSAVFLAGSAYTFPAVGTWTLVSGSGTFSDPTDPGAEVTGLAVGENIFQWTVDAGPCNNGVTTDQVSVFVFDANNPVADAGPDQDLCTPTTSTSLSGSPVVFPATGTWSVVSGTASVVAPNDPNSSVIDLSVGESVLVWTVDNGTCATGITRDTVVIRLFDDAMPMADAGPDQSICTPGNSVTLAGSPLVGPATGQWTVAQGTGTFFAPNSPNTLVTSLSIGVNVLVWTVDNGPCSAGVTSDSLTVLVFDANVGAANAGPDQDLCTPDTETQLLADLLTPPATGTWTIISGPGSVVDPSDPQSTLSGLQVGETVLIWTLNNGPCPNPISRDTVRIRLFDANNPPADAGPDQQVCTPVTSATLQGSPVIFPVTGTWTLVSGQGTITDPSDPNTTVTGLGLGQNTFEWVVDNSHCATGVTSDQVDIFLFDLNAPPADAGPDQQICTPNSSVMLQGNVPTPPAIGVWSVVQGTATIQDVNDPNSVVEDLVVGETILSWSIDNGLCGASTDLVSLFVFDDAQPPASAGIDQQLCTPQDSTFLAAEPPIFPGFGTWTLVQGAGSFTDPNDPTTEVSGLAIGDNIFQWTVFNGPCNYTDSLDQVVITLFDDSTAAAGAGPDLQTCIPFNTIILQADTPQAPATGTWTLLSGGGTIVSPNDPASNVTGLPVGINTFLWTLDNGPCANNGILADTMAVFVYDPSAPTANAGPDQSLCTPDTTTFLAGNTPLFPGVGTWTLLAGSAVIADPNDPNSFVSGLGIGDNVLVWQIYNGDCGFGPPSTDTVVVRVNDATHPPASTGSDQSWCTPVSSAVMQANDAVPPATGSWSLASGTGNFADPNDANTLVSGLVVGSSAFVWTIDNGACGTTSDTLVVELFDQNAAPADAGPDQDICVPTFPNTVNMAGSVPTGPAIGTWTLVSGTGTIVDPNDPLTPVTDLLVGVNVFAWTVVNGPCDTTTSQMTVFVYDAAQPVADAGPDQDLCSPDNTVQLAGNTPNAPASGTWTILSGTGTLSDASDPGASLSGLLPGQTVLVWSVDNGPCPNGITSDTVLVTVFDGSLMTAAAGPDQTFCSPLEPPITMLASTVSLPAIGTWALISGSATIVSPNDPFTEITGLGLGENVFEWTVDNGVCGTTSDQVGLVVYDGSVPAADAGPDQIFCQDMTGTQLNAVPATSTAVGAWSVITGPGAVSAPGDPASSVWGMGLGQNVFLWTVSNGECGSTADTVLVLLEDCLTLTIPDAFSPNGDGVNDLYVIDNLESYPQNSLQVFNRWGSKVLDRTPYRNDWDGRSEGEMNWGEELPESTYYYILDLNDGSDPYSGYIYLRR